MRTNVDLLWRSEANRSLEHFSLRSGAASWLLAGTVVLDVYGRPAHIVYRVELDDAWTTTRVSADLISGDSEQRIDVEVDAGLWVVNGQSRADLSGCIDVDLGWTPATNTLPIRRCRPSIGETVEVNAAWVRFPELTVVKALQTYERCSETRWVYRSETYEASIVTTPDGVVTDYDDGLWTTQSWLTGGS